MCYWWGLFFTGVFCRFFFLIYTLELEDALNLAFDGLWQDTTWLACFEVLNESHLDASLLGEVDLLHSSGLSSLLH